MPNFWTCVPVPHFFFFFFLCLPVALNRMDMAPDGYRLPLLDPQSLCLHTCLVRTTIGSLLQPPVAEVSRSVAAALPCHAHFATRKENPRGILISRIFGMGSQAKIPDHGIRSLRSLFRSFRNKLRPFNCSWVKRHGCRRRPASPKYSQCLMGQSDVPIRFPDTPPAVCLVAQRPQRAGRELVVRALIAAVALIAAIMTVAGGFHSSPSRSELLSWSTSFDDG